jgi:hypothetical protein
VHSFDSSVFIKTVNILTARKTTSFSMNLLRGASPIPKGFRDKALSLHSSKMFDKKAILRAVSNTGIYCSSDTVGTVYMV